MKVSIGSRKEHELRRTLTDCARNQRSNLAYRVKCAAAVLYPEDFEVRMRVCGAVSLLLCFFLFLCFFVSLFLCFFVYVSSSLQ